MSNVLFDCSQCRFPLEEIFREIDAGLYSYTDFHQMTPRFQQHRPYRIGPLDPAWNSFDRLEEGTRLIHYTNLCTQPWKFPGHDHEDVWFRVFEDARKTGLISSEDVDKTRLRGYVRQDILQPGRGNVGGNAAGRAASDRADLSQGRPRTGAEQACQLTNPRRGSSPSRAQRS